MSTITGYQWLVSETGSQWQELVVRGTGIRASTLALAVTNEGRTAQQVAVDFSLPLAAVEESLDYAQSHADEINRERLEMDQALIRRELMNQDGSWKSISTTTT